jgi:hypothetical protein
MALKQSREGDAMTERRDSRGRRRAAGQERGLRPLYPALAPGWRSRALRVAMPEPRWREFDERVALARRAAPTEARAAGEVLMELMDAAARHPTPHWLDWEREKTLRLLRAAERAA